MPFYRDSIVALGGSWPLGLGALCMAYLIGSIPWAYFIVRAVNGQDITAHGTGNVGAMNVRRSTGSWAWFSLAMVADALKGIVPVAAVTLLIAQPSAFEMWLTPGAPVAVAVLPYRALVQPFVVAGCVIGHNYSLWMWLIKGQWHRTGKGLATGGGALLAYDWRYFVIVVAIGLATIALTKYMMAGQVAAAIALPVGSLILRSPDWPFALLMGALVYSAHHRRFVGLLAGREPRLYIEDRMGPRG
jgi:glycerol-3-phosphate acyltransferase PlsY